MEEENIDYTGYKILLKPSDEIINVFKRYFGARTFMYNWGKSHIDAEYENSKTNGYKFKTPSDKSMNRILTNLKTEPETEWLNKYDVYSLREGLHAVYKAYESFYKHRTNKPFYHKRKFANKSFSIRGDRLSIFNDRVRIPSIGFVKIGGRIPSQIVGFGDKGIEITNKSRKRKSIYENMMYRKYTNPRVIFDGCKYYLVFALPRSEKDGTVPNSCRKYKQNEIWSHKQEISNEVIGIDIGCKLNNWMVCSNGLVLKRRSQEKLEKRLKRNQRKYFRQKKALELRNRTTRAKTKPYTNSMIKTLNKYNKDFKTIRNRKINDINVFTSRILDMNPSIVVMENFNVKSWYVTDESIPKKVRQKINKTIRNAMPFELRKIVSNKLRANGVSVILADEEYPSTQLCSKCGHQQKVEIYQRTYRCPVCGNVIDRDLNASINLQHYGEDFIKSRNLEIA